MPTLKRNCQNNYTFLYQSKNIKAIITYNYYLIPAWISLSSSRQLCYRNKYFYVAKYMKCIKSSK